MADNLYFSVVWVVQKPRTCGTIEAFYNVFQQTIHFYLAFVAVCFSIGCRKETPRTINYFLIQYRSSYLRRENIFVQFCKNNFQFGHKKESKIVQNNETADKSLFRLKSIASDRNW